MPEEIQNPGLTEDEKYLLTELMQVDDCDLSDFAESRRQFLKIMTLAGGGLVASHLFGSQSLSAQSLIDQPLTDAAAANLENSIKLSFKINGLNKSLQVDSRMTLLDTLRERLELTGSKKGCDHGQCGACTVIIDGRRVLSCLTLAATCQGKSVTSIEGIAKGGSLHPVQTAFIKHDGFQCGYCTSGQICSAVALMDEAKRGEASYVTPDVRSVAGSLQLSDEEIRERMSGNICRCGAYPNIVAAIREVHTGKDVAQHWHFREQESTFALIDSQTEKGENHAAI